ncbi:zinc-binding dehydrogenase [Bosea sp. TAF32]|uniref:zinc-binding dehydrogenase n=1 Tax=Bosea sp. TAF32 TaxID=3237482 RepID=UPI003F8F71A1
MSEFVRDKERLARASAFIDSGLAGGRLKPVVAKTFTLDEIVKAHVYMESSEQFGEDRGHRPPLSARRRGN